MSDSENAEAMEDVANKTKQIRLDSGEPSDETMQTKETGNEDLRIVYNTGSGEQGYSEESPCDHKPYDLHGKDGKVFKSPGRIVIINNDTFKHTLLRKLPGRPGSKEDANELEKVMKELNFEVIREDNKTAEEMIQIAEREATGDADFGCFFMAIMTHGSKDDILHGTDHYIHLKDLTSRFKVCQEKLLNKPKIFITQACRGDEEEIRTKTPESDPSTALSGPITHDGGTSDEDDGRTVTLPVQADFLYVYSCYPGYKSQRNKTDKVSLFIEALCNNLRRYGHLDLHTVLAYVNGEVAADPHEKLQMPTFTSTLTKPLYLRDKAGN